MVVCGLADCGESDGDFFADGVFGSESWGTKVNEMGEEVGSVMVVVRLWKVMSRRFQTSIAREVIMNVAE